MVTSNAPIVSHTAEQILQLISLAINDNSQPYAVQCAPNTHKFVTKEVSAENLDLLTRIAKKPQVKDLFFKRSGKFVSVMIVFHPSAYAKK